MLITVNARKQFRKVILWGAMLIFLLVLGAERLLQERSEAAAARAKIINHWVQGEIGELADPEIRAIWNNIGGKLAILSSRFKHPERTAVKGDLIDITDFSNKHREHSGSASQWRRKDDSNLEINFAFGTFIDKQSPLSTTAPAMRATQISDDKERYEKFIFDLQALFQVHPSIKLSRRDFSDAMMDYFGIKDSIQQRLPNVAITLIYAASDRETITIYPGCDITFSNRPLKETPWYQSAFDPSKAKPEYVIPGNEDFGLSPFYPDYASQEYTRTFWHKVRAEKGGAYLLCVDLTLERQDQQTAREWFDRIPGIRPYAGPGRDWLRAATVGVIFGGVFLAFGLILTHLGGQQSTKLARWIISGKSLPKQTESGDQFKPVFRVFRVFAARGATIVNSVEHGKTETKKTVFNAWLPMKAAKIEAELVNIDSKDASVAMTQVDDLEALDKDPSTRGLERWEIFRDKGSEVGNCRLCSQEVRYKDKAAPIGTVTIKHGIDPLPIVEPDINSRSHIEEIKGLKERIVWQALDVERIEVNVARDLESPPPPRVPIKIQKMRFARKLMSKYRLLNEGRYEVDDCIVISEELFNGRNVRAFCRVAYFEKLRGTGADALKVLRMGDIVTRIFITDTKDAMRSFVKENRDELKGLLDQKNQRLFVTSLEDLQIEKITAFPELDFAIVDDEDFKCVLVSKLSEVSKAAKVSGYVSWREADVAFYETLFQRLKGGHPLNEDVLNGFGD